MAERTVIWTLTAARQRRKILQFWMNKNQSNAYAKKLILLIDDRIKTILASPLAFPKTDFQDVRVSSLGHFSLFYKLTANHLIIVAFWDNRQNPSTLLELIRH